MLLLNHHHHLEYQGSALESFWIITTIYGTRSSPLVFHEQSQPFTEPRAQYSLLLNHYNKEPVAQHVLLLNHHNCLEKPEAQQALLLNYHNHLENQKLICAFSFVLHLAIFMILAYDSRALTCACLPVLVLTRKTLNSRARWAVPPLAPPPSSTWPACFQPIDSGQEILGKDDIYKPLFLFDPFFLTESAVALLITIPLCSPPAMWRPVDSLREIKGFKGSVTWDGFYNLFKI